MRIGSITIGGIERVNRVLLRDFEIILDSGDRMGSCRMLVLYNPDAEPTLGAAELGSAVLGTAIVTGQLVEIYSSSEDSDTESGELWGEAIFGQPLFGEAETTQLEFSGIITNIEREVMVAHGTTDGSTTLWGEPEFGGPLFGDGTAAYRVNVLRIECRDWNSLLENAIVAPGTAAFANKTDQEIITTLFAATQPGIDITNVEMTAMLATFPQVENQSLRSILVRLADLTGAFWYVDQNKSLHWFLPSTRVAPFSLSEEPDYTASFPFDRQSFRYTEEWRTPANRVTVLGEVTTGGARVRETVAEAPSISAYGTFGRTISDRSITSSDQAKARARVELANYAYPQYNGVVVQRRGGLSVGEMLTINARQLLHLNNAFVIRRIRLSWWSRPITNYEIEWGSYRPDLARAIRTAFELAYQGQPTGVQPTTPAPGTVGSGELLPNSVGNANLQALSVGSANIQNASIGTAQIQSGAIQEAHLQNAIISTAKIQDAAITNAKIDTLAADKITTGSLVVGGSNANIFVGSTGSPAAWIGTYGGNNGGWFKELYVGGGGPSNAKIKSNSAGALQMVMDSGDGITIADSGSGHDIRLNANGLAVFQYGSGTNRLQAIYDSIYVYNGGNSAGFQCISGTPELRFNSAKILGTQRTGWTAASGTATKGGFATGSVTLSSLAESVKALIDDLMTHGLISA